MVPPVAPAVACAPEEPNGCVDWVDGFSTPTVTATRSWPHPPRWRATSPRISRTSAARTASYSATGTRIRRRPPMRYSGSDRSRQSALRCDQRRRRCSPSAGVTPSVKTARTTRPFAQDDPSRRASLAVSAPIVPYGYSGFPFRPASPAPDASLSGTMTSAGPPIPAVADDPRTGGRRALPR